ncbi:hypothetical protein ROHU_028274 [Labeo rohita]|uniref:Uncharacterized protein n=1 Tax=Labeo rohita TaxID=84645 RepID=A0A498M7I1_LABRO|nr:hypothetical protein ROHU_028274 [Labeo rohita]
MSWISIANILGIGLSTLSRRRSVFGRLDNYDAIKNSQQDDIIRDINAHTSNVGQRLVQGSIRGRGYRVQRHRVRERICLMDQQEL